MGVTAGRASARTLTVMGVLASFHSVVREAVVADKKRSSVKRDPQEPITTAHSHGRTTKN